MNGLCRYPRPRHSHLRLAVLGVDAGVAEGDPDGRCPASSQIRASSRSISRTVLEETVLEEDVSVNATLMCSIP
jgi:hypothetical protein